MAKNFDDIPSFSENTFESIPTLDTRTFESIPEEQLAFRGAGATGVWSPESFLERTTQGLKEIVAAPVRATESMIGGFGGLAEMTWESASFGDIVTRHIDIPLVGVAAEHLIRKYGPEKPVAWYDKKLKEHAETGRKFNEFFLEQANKGWEAPNPEITEASWSDRPFSKGAGAVMGAIPSLAGMVATAAATKSPTAALGVMAADETGSMYHRLRRQGTSPFVASKLAQLAGAWTYVTNIVPFGRLLKPHNRTIIEALKQGGWEGLQEVVEGIGHNMLEYFGYDYRKPEDIPTAVKSAVDHAMDDWIDNLVGGIGAGGISSAVLGTSGDTESQKKARQLTSEIVDTWVAPPNIEDAVDIPIQTTEDLFEFMDVDGLAPEIPEVPTTRLRQDIDIDIEEIEKSQFQARPIPKTRDEFADYFDKGFIKPSTKAEALDFDAQWKYFNGLSEEEKSNRIVAKKIDDGDVPMEVIANAESAVQQGATPVKAWNNAWRDYTVKQINVQANEPQPLDKGIEAGTIEDEISIPKSVNERLIYIGRTAPKLATTLNQEIERLMADGLSEEQAVNILKDLRKEGVPFELVTKPGEITDVLKEAQKRYEDSEFDPGEINDHEQREFKRPGIFSWLTARWRVLRNIGAEYIALPIEARFFRYRLEQLRFHQLVNKVVKSLNKQATLGDRIAGRILNRNTKPVDKLVDMLDTYEWSPDWMSEKDAKQFDQLRSYTKWLLNTANLERKKAGLPLINDLKSYIPHFREHLAELIVEKKVPQQTGYIWKLMQGLPRTIKNPTAMRRTMEVELDEHWNRNLGDLLKAVATYDLRDMYLTRPVQAAFDEIFALRKSGEIPPSTAKYIEDYLRFDILKHKAPLDEAFNVTVKYPVQVINKILKPIGHTINDPANSIFSTLRSLTHLGALALRIRPVTRNLGQRLLNLTLYRGRDLVKAQFGKDPITTHPNTGEPVRVTDLVRETEWYQMTRGLPEDVNIESEAVLNMVLRHGMIPFRASHVGNRYFSNVEISAKVGYYDWLYRYTKSHDKNSRYYKHIEKYSKAHDVPITELQTQKEDMMPDIRDAVRLTQWEYFSTSMPTIMRGQVGRSAAIYQSWWMNWWFNHMAEATSRMVTGRTKKRGDGTGGRLLSPYARYRAANGMSMIVGLARFAESAFGIVALSSLILPGPTGLPPGIAFIAGLALAFTSNRKEDKKKGWRMVKNSLSLLLPFKNFIKDFHRFISAEGNLSDLIFYTEQKQNK